MIRREIDSTSTGWLVFRQIEHARLSADLARQWASLPELTKRCHAPVEALATLIQAIERHDDGWFDWDAELAVRQGDTVPRDYGEMEAFESRMIWSSSIQNVDMLAPLGPWLVAKHFLSFWQRRVEAAPYPDPDEVAFVQEFAPLVVNWQREMVRDQGWSEVALGHLESVLPFFDLLSLRLCSGNPQQKLEIEDWKGDTIEFRPIASSHASSIGDLRASGHVPLVSYEVSPWPFLGDLLELQADAFFVDRVSMETNRPQSAVSKSPGSGQTIAGFLLPETRRDVRWQFRPAAGRGRESHGS